VLLGNGLFDRVHVADRPAYLTAIADAASEHEERLVEFRLRRDLPAERTVQFLWVEMRCRPRETVGKNLSRSEIVAVLRDISERKSANRAIEIALLESEEANAAKIGFIATMGHELRTPLNAIIGFSDMLTSESLKLDASRKSEYARLINDSGRHLLSVVDGILDASKMSTGNFEISLESFAPSPAIESCANLLALKAREEGVELRLDIGPDLPSVMADRRAFNQILINLVSNAIKFTPRDGQVVVTASRERTKLAVTVEDNGIGIDESDLPRLGEAFFQASATREHRHDGSGLGLSIVKSLVHLHGGDVAIQSRIGEGTRVTVRLPFEGASGTSTGDLIKFVPERARGIGMTANIQVTKSA
jgi:cell cycle sensor histidine kinase DivJ